MLTFFGGCANIFCSIVCGWALCADDTLAIWNVAEKDRSEVLGRRILKDNQPCIVYFESRMGSWSPRTELPILSRGGDHSATPITLGTTTTTDPLRTDGGP